MLVARDDPLDTYLVHHPEALFGRPVEATVLDPGNPYVLAPHLCAAAAELPLTEADLRAVRAGRRPSAATWSSARPAARSAPAGWYWTSPAGPRPAPDHPRHRRRAGPVVESATGRLLGTVDEPSAHVPVHTGAVYLHQGETYLVAELDLDDGVRPGRSPATPD